MVLALALWHRNSRATSRRGTTATDAQRLAIAGDYEGAVEVARAAAEAHPQDIEAWGVLGNSLCKLGQLDEAAAAAHTILEIEPTTPGVHTVLSSIHRVKFEFAKATSEAELELANSPNDPQAHYNFVAACRRSGQLGRAAKMYADNVASSPDDPLAHYGLGVVAYSSSDWKTALVEFHEALRLDPDLGAARTQAAAVLMALERWTEAEGQLREAIDARTDPQAEVVLGRLLNMRQRYAEAEKHLRSYIARHPPHAAAHSGLAWSLWQQGRDTEALDQYREAVRWGAAQHDTYANLGLLLLERGETEEAISILRKALVLKSDDAAAHRDLARALHLQGEDAEAREHLLEAQRLGQDVPDDLLPLPQRGPAKGAE